MIHYLWYNHIMKYVKKSLTFGKCKKIFDNVKSFKIHINVCTGESKYKCYVCGKQFDDDISCNSHSEKCTGRLVCKKCELGFEHWKMLLQHYKNVIGMLCLTCV